MNWRDYLQVLLSSAQRSEVMEVAETLEAMTTKPEMIAYLSAILAQNPEKTRVHEIAYELMHFLTGEWVAA